MTRFCGDAVSVRSKGASAYTKKDLRKNMEKFIQTGVHPDIAKAQEKAKQNQIPVLPDHDPNREFVFIELQYGKEVLGRLVIELFGDVVPAAANHLRNRCQHGSRTGLQGAQVHKLQAKYAFWLGKDPLASEGLRVQPNPRLRHVDAGAVSISHNGDEVAISLGRALVLDSTHQVVGRVHLGKDILERLNDVATDHNDIPLRKLTVSLCGPTNATGSYEELDASRSGKAKDPLQRLAEESQGARESVVEALAVGLGQKRKAEDTGSGEGGSGAGVVGAAGSSKVAVQGSGGTGGAARNVRSKLMDAMLGDLSGESSSEEEEEEEEED